MNTFVSRMCNAMSVLLGYVTIGANLAEFPSGITVQSPWITLTTCMHCINEKIPGAYLRFGDGDINLLEGRDELLQQSRGTLSSEMREVFSLNGAGIIKGLPLHAPRFGLCKGMSPGIFGASDEWAERILSRCYPYFIGTPIYSSVALAYLFVFDRVAALNFLKFLRERTPLFVGNEAIPVHVLLSLFDSAQWVPTPEKNAFSSIDEIEKSVVSLLDKRDRHFDVVVTAMGCSGRVLAKRLLRDRSRRVFVYDFGSLMDAFSGWSTRAWIEIAGLEPVFYKEMLVEVQGREMNDAKS